MKKLIGLSLLMSFYVPSGYSFFGSVARDVPIYGVADQNTEVRGTQLQVVHDTGYMDKPAEQLETISCTKLTDKSVPLKMINALRYSTRDRMKTELVYDKAKGTYRIKTKFPYMMTDCFKPSVRVRRYGGNFVIEVQNHYFDGQEGNYKATNTMGRYEECLAKKGILKDGKLDRNKAHFGTYVVSDDERDLSDIFDGKSRIDHIEALFASPKETPREFLTPLSNLAPDQPNNCFNFEYFNGMRQDLLTAEELANHRFEWICAGNGNVLDVDELLTTMPRGAGNYSAMIKDLNLIKKSMQESRRLNSAHKLREQLKAAVKKVKKARGGDRYQYEMAVNDYFTILSKLESKDLKPLLDELIDLKKKVSRSKGTEHARLLKKLHEVENELRFYSRFLTYDMANRLAKDGFYDEAKLTYLFKTIVEKRTMANKKAYVGRNKKGKKRYVMIDSYEDFYEYAELTYKKKTRAKYKDYQRVFQIKEEGASYAEDSYEKAKEIAKNADKKYNAFMKKLQKYCKRNFFGIMKDKKKCEAYQKQWPKQAARRQKGYEIAGKYLGEAKRYQELEGARNDIDDDEFGYDEADVYNPETFYQANMNGSYQRYGNPYMGQQNSMGMQGQFGGGYNPYGMQQNSMFGQPQYGQFGGGYNQFGMSQQYNQFGGGQFGGGMSTSPFGNSFQFSQPQFGQSMYGQPMYGQPTYGQPMMR